MGVSVGDRVQIRDGGMDVTNGVKAKAGKMYGEGGPLWAEVTQIVDDWKTHGKFGLPSVVTKVRCAKDGVIVWQVQPQDIAGQSIQKSEPVKTTAPPVKDSTPSVEINTDSVARSFQSTHIGSTNAPIANSKGSTDWSKGVSSSVVNINTPTQGTTQNSDEDTQVITGSAFTGDGDNTPTYVSYDTSPGSNDGTLPQNMKNVSAVKATYKTAWQNPKKKAQMLNQNTTLIQNNHAYPYHVGSGGSPNYADKYDYQFILGDPKYKYKPSDYPSLEAKLTEIRARLGLHVHGNNDIARSVKYYMYNRFKVPDINLAHNRSFTHVFFTRPDLNLLADGNTANAQAMNHTDTALIWRRHPELFKLLTDCGRCQDENNFNMLLSNQVTSFTLQDEELATIRAGRSWAEHEMVYGEQYTGRTAGTFSCNFVETSDYSIINLIKLWMTYIDNVSRGAWRPNYNSAHCHVFDRALDYGASVYMFKVGPDGEDVLYWTKYYGVFPIVSGSSALGWDNGTPVGNTPNLNINFAYSYKKDLSPISLLEFNHVSGVEGHAEWLPSYNAENAGSTRPFVGAPYIELNLGETNNQINDASRATKQTQIRLKFRKDNSSRRTDEILYKAHS